MKQKTKEKKAMEFLTEYLRKAGHSTEVIEQAKEVIPTTSDAISLQGEAVLLFIERPARFTMKKCKLCGEVFGTNYRYVGYCSDTHRAKHFQNQTGIPWNHYKRPEEAWGGEKPLVIPPEALKRLRHFALMVVTYFDLVQNQSETIGKVVAGKLLLPEELQQLIDLAQNESLDNGREVSSQDNQKEFRQYSDDSRTIPEQSHQPLVPQQDSVEDYPFAF